MVSSVWGHKIAALRTKKSRRFRRLLKLITGRRQTEWTGATRCPNEDNVSHKGESLTDRKRAIFFRDYLPCRPLAEFGLDSVLARVGSPDGAQRNPGPAQADGPLPDFAALHPGYKSAPSEAGEIMS